MAKKHKEKVEVDQVQDELPVKIAIKNKVNFPVYIELGEEGSIHLLPKQVFDITEEQLQCDDVKKHLKLDNILIIRVK